MMSNVLQKRSIVFIMFLACTLLSARWIPFTDNALPTAAQVELLAADAFSINAAIQVNGAMIEEIDTRNMIDTRNEAFVRFSIPDAYHTGEIGKPQLPAIKQTIGVPYGAVIKFEVVNAEYVDIPLHMHGVEERIMPALAPVLKMPGEKPVLVIDDKTYDQNAFYPEAIASIEGDDFMRGHRLAVIATNPIQYNPVTGIIRCYTSIELRIEFAGGDMIKTREEVLQSYSPLFEDFIKQRVINYSFYDNITKGVLPLPIHYLIITHNNFQTQVADLARWLKQKGFKVKVANQDSISTWTTNGIETYIDAQNPQPSYLLLVGDVNGGYMPAPIGGNSNKVTDLYYAETDGSGYLPDIFYGRLSVETAAHITTIVQKILKYEKADLPNMADWFKKDAFLAGNDNYTVSEGTHNYCTSTFMDPHGYTTYKLYEQTYGATTADVFTNVNEGRILTTMSGHGLDDGWHDGPPFTVSHVNQLTNGDKLTIATGHCCLANNFGWSNMCGGESWIRKENGGAVAYYGSCPSTYWDEDDWLEREWYEAIYADSIYEHARFTLDGMYDGVELSGTSPFWKQYYYEAYHVLGDPSLDMWTEVPTTMTVTHDGAVIPGSAAFAVTVSGTGGAIENALVCVWIPGQTPEMHISEYTEASGTATISIAPTTPGDTMYVTVTAHNYVPYEGHAMVIAPSGPYVTAGSCIINDGNNNQANPGETIQLGLWAKNIGVATANSVHGMLSETDTYVTMNTDSTWYGNIAASDSALSNPYFDFTIANNCPNAHNIGFTAAFTDDLDSTWTSNVSVTVYAPLLTYEEHTISGGNGNAVLEPGETVTLVVTLENEGGAQAANISSTLLTTSPDITINDGSGSFGTIAAGAMGSNTSDPYSVTADIATPYGTEVDFSVAVQSGIYVDTLDFSLIIGQLVPTDTGYYYVYYSGGPHTYSPVFDWIAIDSTQTQYPGVSLNLGDDQVTQVTIPFSFQYYGGNYTQLTISSNGWVCMGYQSSSSLTNYGIPNAGGPPAMIAGIWDDLDPGNAGQPSDIYYYYDAANHRFIIEYFRVEHYSSGSHETFEIILHDPLYHPSPTGDGDIIVQYLVGLQQTDNTLGIENGGENVGIQYYLDGAYHELAVPVTDSFALRYTTYDPGYVGIEDYEKLTGLPVRTVMAQVYPNPFARDMRVSYQVASRGRVSLEVYDALGREVRGLVDGVSEPGYYTVAWDGCDDQGRRVPAGVYFVRFNTDDYQNVQKTVLLK
ncbi:MAG: C25 family cysteine peptidase [candidate division WOR-3 bacterium]